MGTLVAHRLLEADECLTKREPASRPT